MNGRTKIVAMVLVALVIGFGSITIINSSSRQKKVEIAINELKAAKTVDEFQTAIANAKALSPRAKETVLIETITRAEEMEDWARAIGTWKEYPTPDKAF